MLTFSSLTRPLRSVIMITVIFFVAFLQPQVAYANVSKKFNVARALFEKKRYRQAERVLRSIIKQYPDHRASYYLLGRLAYRFGKSRLAARYFLKSGSAYTSTGGAFEYGITMFTIKKYNLAIKGLKRVSRRSSYRSVANFYIGVSYYNQQRYAQAEIYLRRASRLPQKLENSRRAFLREAMKQRQFERAGRFIPQQPIYIPPPSQQNYNYQYYQTYPGGEPPPLPPGAGMPPRDAPSGVKPKNQIEPPPEPSYGFSNSTTPRLEYTKSTTLKDNHAYAGSESSTQGISGGVGLNLRYDERGGSVYNLLLDVGFQDKNTTGSNFKNIVYEDDPGNIIATRTDNDPALNKSATAQFKPQVELALAKGFNVNASFDFVMTLPEMKLDNATQTRTPALSLQLTFGDTSVEGGAALSEFVDAEGNTLDQLTNLSASVSRPFDTLTASFSFGLGMVSTPSRGTIGGFEQRMSLGASLQKAWDRLSLKIAGTHLQNTPPSETIIGGTHASNTFTAELSLPFEFGISLTLGGKYVLIDQHVTKLSETPDGAEEAVEVGLAASGDTQGFNGTAKFSPVDWGFVSATYSHDMSTYSFGDKERLTDFQQATPDRVTSTSFAFGVNWSF